MPGKRILIATDVPYWRSCTGAQQRILHLVKALGTDVLGEHVIGTFYVGEKFGIEDADRVAELGLSVEHHQSHDPPSGAMKRIRWHVDGTLHFVRQAFRDRSQSKEALEPVLLEDFCWPWAMEAFADQVNRFEPDVVICEYVKMAYLLDGVDQTKRQQIAWAIDTHDVLHQRQQQFVEFGFDHWLIIGKNQESRTLSKFDAVMSINAAESVTFREMSPGSEVITVGHSVEPLVEENGLPDAGAVSQDGLVIGYIGSGNASNSHALTKFFRTAWPVVRKSLPGVKLVVAGSIGDWLLFQEDSLLEDDDPVALRMELTADPQVELLGRVDHPRAFYRRIDLSLNPVEFGTGLKIKCCEACAFGVPSVVTTQALDSVPKEAASAFLAANSVLSMAGLIQQLGEDAERLRGLKEEAMRVAKEVFNDGQAYGDFAKWLSG